MTSGDRPELSITVRSASGGVISTPANVQLYQNGVPIQQSSTSHGRAFFVPQSFGNFTIAVDATGYKSAQKDISAMIPGRMEIDVYLERDLAANESPGVPGKPILAPKAQEALTKGTEALQQGKLDDAEKYISKAVKLAPANPDVLYVQGMLLMKQRNWETAQTVLQKSDQI